MKRSQVVAVAGGSAILIAVAGFSGASAMNQPTPEPTTGPAVTFEQREYEPAPEKVAVEEAPAPAIEEAPVVEAPAEPVGPTLCPEGTTAGAVDGAGNESNCQPLNEQGQECVAYDANNNCTAWYKP